MLVDTLLKNRIILRVCSAVLFCFLPNKSIFTIRRGFSQVNFFFLLTPVEMKSTAVYSPGQTGQSLADPRPGPPPPSRRQQRSDADTDLEEPATGVARPRL